MGALINLDHPAHVVKWHFIQLSVANIVVLALMLVVFAVAIALPFPGASAGEPARRGPAVSAAPTPAPRPTSWTGRVREAAVARLPPDKLLPEGQPTYVASWIYVFGVASLASLVVIVGSGMILALKGPAWWHDTGVGHFFNSIHL